MTESSLGWAALVMIGSGWAARLGLRRDLPWLPAAFAAGLFGWLTYVGYDPHRAAPLVGAALLAGLALTRLDGGRPGAAVTCGFIVLFNLGAVGWPHELWAPRAAGMPVLPVLLALWAALIVGERRQLPIWLLVGLVGLVTAATHAPSLGAGSSAEAGAETLPLATVAVFALSRRLYPTAKSAGPAVTALFIGSLLLVTVAGSYAELRVGEPVAGWLGCCLAALLPALLDESRTEPDSSFGLDRYFVEALALAGALGLGWLQGF